jgi:ribosomal protein L18
MSRVEQKKLQKDNSNMTDAAAAKLSGADLAQAAQVTKASTTVGPGKDGARVEQLVAGISG